MKERIRYYAMGKITRLRRRNINRRFEVLYVQERVQIRPFLRCALMRFMVSSHLMYVAPLARGLPG